MTQVKQNLRRGLPRVAGGAPWPPLSQAPGAAAAPTIAAAPDRAVPSSPKHAITPVRTEELSTAQAPVAEHLTAPIPAAPQATVHVRRGLPRVAGGEPWPPLTVAASVVDTRLETEIVTVAPPASAAAPPNEPAHAQVHAQVHVQSPTPPTSEPAQAAPAQIAAYPVAPVDAPGPTTPPTTAPATSPTATPVSAPMSTRRSTARRVGWAAIATIAAAGLIVLAARGVTTLPGVPEFMARYPGEYELPAFVAEGFSAWARWTHFLNFFFMALIVRTGLLVRQQQTPPAFYTPRRGGKKVSINLWVHTSVDVLWMANGLVFIVLLFVTGHWARIVPTSWEVFPNALSAALQYLTLEWPVEDGWINYNSLQQLMYFVVVFVAAPLAILSGVRMSEWWPKRATRLSRMLPAEAARAIHFPVMLFYVLFAIVHVFLVLTTGALKNLGHMFAGVSEPSWFGFWWFAGSLVATTAVIWAARPLIVAPVAQLFGRVSAR